jgi:hypothetical protein
VITTIDWQSDVYIHARLAGLNGAARHGVMEQGGGNNWQSNKKAEEVQFCPFTANLSITFDGLDVIVSESPVK